MEFYMQKVVVFGAMGGANLALPPFLSSPLLSFSQGTCGDPQGYVESFLKRYVDNESTVIYQSVLLEPVRKPTPLSKNSTGKIKPLTSREKKELGLKQIPLLEHK